jgi:hypothetical protein
MVAPFLRLEMLFLFQRVLCAVHNQRRRLRKEYSRLSICSALLIICLTTAFCEDQVPTGRKKTDVKLKVQERDIEINLDFTPMTDPISILVLLSEDTQAKVVHYARNQLTVVAIYQGNLSDAYVSPLLARTGDPAFVEALQRKNFGGTGQSNGNQFYLSFKSKESVTGECFGFVDDAPAVVRNFIEDLLALKQQLKEVALSAAYVRSEPIARERFEAIQRSGKLRFASIQEFSPDIQSTLTSAVARPRDFLALSPIQYEQLLPQTTHGHEFFMTVNGSGYQLSLFQARDGTAPPTKGDK